MGKDKRAGRVEVEFAASAVNSTTNRNFAVVNYGEEIGVFDWKDGKNFPKTADGYESAIQYMKNARQEYLDERASENEGLVWCGHVDCLGYYLPHEH